MKQVIKVKGVQDELEVHESKIIITPKGVLGFINKGMKGAKEIPFSSITAIQFKEAGTIISGYIQFTLMGGNESKGGIFGATNDENTFMFVKKENDKMKKVKEYMQERIGSNNKSLNNTSSSLSMADEILKLNKLLSDGIIDENEFKVMKDSIIKNVA